MSVQVCVDRRDFLPSGAVLREPAVAGMFYPSDPEILFESIHRCFTHSLGPGRFPTKRSGPSKRVECLVVPHAGYEYSGPIAAHSYNVAFDIFCESKGTLNVIILGPNHYGIGSGLAISSADGWKTPSGVIDVNKELRRSLCNSCEIVDVNDGAHSREHSIEVQLPFLQAISRNSTGWSFLPVSMMLQDIETAIELGDAITKIISESPGRFLVIASSDLTHYESQVQAKLKDENLLDQVKKVDLTGFYTVLERSSVSACGYGPIAAVLHIASSLGKSAAAVLKYATSGDVTGDYSSVVGYPSVRFV